MFAEFAFYVVNSSYGTVLWPRFFYLAFTQHAFEKKNFSQDNSSSFCQKFIISCYGYCWREGGQFSLNPKNPKLSSATIKNTLSNFLHSRTDAEGNQNQDMLRTPDNCFGNFKGKFSLSIVKSGEECRLYGMCKWRGLLVFLFNGFLNCFSET